MQMGGACAWWTPDESTLHGEGNAAMTWGEISTALGAASGMGRDGMGQMTWAEIRSLGYDTGRRAGVVRRGEFAGWMLGRMR